ncbi:MAG: hypothetical protein VKO21_04380 [Candidatus Sericytochromatia bacterium]|nr:hypothetical protein [Candidatus Sericytochromatia bacterium]
MRTSLEPPVEGRVHFRIGRRERLSLYRARGESWERVCLKALAWVLHMRDPRPLQWEPPLEPRLRADLAAVDATGAPTLWVKVAPIDEAAVLHACRHLPRARIQLVVSEEDPEAFLARLRKHVHYRYAHDHLEVVNFKAPLAEWFDPEDLHIPEDAFSLVRL